MSYSLLGLAAVLVLLWVVGFALHLTGGLIHILLLLACFSVLVRVIMVRKVA
jgi:uncharacterized protein DUF5670